MEEEQEREKLYNEAVERKRLLNGLKEDPGFVLYLKELKTQLDRRFSDLVGFPSNLDKIVQNTYTSGEIAGIKLALEFTDTLISYSQATIDMEKALNPIEKEDGETDGENT